jgi:hypothetical protein
MSESPDTFNVHCEWLLHEMQLWTKKNAPKKDLRKKLNWHFRKEINKNTTLLKEAVLHA